MTALEKRISELSSSDSPTGPTLEIAIKHAVDVDSLDTARPLAEIFQPFKATLDKWQAKVESLKVTDISQKTEMAQARLARLELREARCNMDKVRIKLVAGLKERTSKIDTTARTVRMAMESLEETLLESEQFAERFAAKQKAELKVKRESEFQPLVYQPILGDLSELSESEFAVWVADAKLLRQAKIDAAAKVEADRIAREKADREERERIQKENQRLQAEAIEATRLAKQERDRLEAEAAAERKEAKRKSDELEAELAVRRKQEADAAAKLEAERRARAISERKAAAAPDQAKLKAYLAAIKAVPVPRLANLASAALLSENIGGLVSWLESQVDGV